MDLTPYVDQLRHELAVAADAGGDEARALAERLTAPLDSAGRLILLGTLSAAAAEITRELAPGSVDVRLRGLDPEFVVTAPPTERWFAEASDVPAPADVAPTPAVGTEDAMLARINLRLPEPLKVRVEAAAARQGISVNAWLVRAVAATLEEDVRPAGKPNASGGQRLSGWVR